MQDDKRRTETDELSMDELESVNGGIKVERFKPIKCPECGEIYMQGQKHECTKKTFN